MSGKRVVLGLVYSFILLAISAVRAEQLRDSEITLTRGVTIQAGEERGAGLKFVRGLRFELTAAKGNDKTVDVHILMTSPQGDVVILHTYKGKRFESGQKRTFRKDLYLGNYGNGRYKFAVLVGQLNQTSSVLKLARPLTGPSVKEEFFLEMHSGIIRLSRGLSVVNKTSSSRPRDGLEFSIEVGEVSGRDRSVTPFVDILNSSKERVARLTLKRRTLNHWRSSVRLPSMGKKSLRFKLRSALPDGSYYAIAMKYFFRNLVCVSNDKCKNGVNEQFPGTESEFDSSLPSTPSRVKFEVRDGRLASVSRLRPRVYAGEDRVAKSHQVVRLMGMSSRSDSGIAARWTANKSNAIEAPISIDSQNPSNATFVAPTVDSPTPLLFEYSIDGKLGRKERHEIQVIVEPATSGSVLTQFQEFGLLHKSNDATHAVFSSVGKNPKPGTYRAIARVTGMPLEVSFFAKPIDGSPITPIEMSKLSEGIYAGKVLVDDEAFQVVASGKDSFGQSFDVVYAKVFEPTHLSVRFSGLRLLVKPDDGQIGKVSASCESVNVDCDLTITSSRPDLFPERSETIRGTATLTLTMSSDQMQSVSKYDAMRLTAEVSSRDDPAKSLKSSVMIELQP